MSKDNKYQVFVDLRHYEDINDGVEACDSFIVSAKTAADAEDAAWTHIAERQLYQEYLDVYVWDITEDDRVD